jgi:hypothetical protein
MMENAMSLAVVILAIDYTAVLAFAGWVIYHFMTRGGKS